jgi:hypothetical protein
MHIRDCERWGWQHPHLLGRRRRIPRCFSGRQLPIKLPQPLRSTTWLSEIEGVGPFAWVRLHA